MKGINIFRQVGNSTSSYKPIKPSKEAEICLSCSKKNCTGNCKRLNEEKEKLKEIEK